MSEAPELGKAPDVTLQVYALSEETDPVFTRRVVVCVPLDSDPTVGVKSAPVTAAFVLLSIHSTVAVAANPVITHDIVVSVPVITSLLFASTTEIKTVSRKKNKIGITRSGL